jgi:4-hydroxy-tetrahydrodipicolinate synthase
MMQALAGRLSGIHAATIVPMRADFSIDETALATHIGRIANTPGIRGLLVNGHAGENFLLDLDEKRTVMRIARAVAPEGCFITCGVNHESSLAAAREASAMEAEGADGLLVFPPNSWALDHSDEAVVAHHGHVRDATTIPMLLYGAPVGAGSMAYGPDILLRLAEDPRVVAIKEGSWEVARYEANLRLLKARRPDFIVLGSGDEHLLTSYIIGSAGSQVSLAAVVPEATCNLWDAAESGDWDAAREAHERIYPLAVAIYRDAPGGRANARLKACLRILGRLDNDRVRPPQPSATCDEYRKLEAALAAFG